MRTVIVLLKDPRPGQVKTRLAAVCGARRAAILYREWIGFVLARLQPLRGPVSVVGYFDGATKDAFAHWDSLVDDWWAQPKGDLGERLAAGFEVAHLGGGPVVAIGTDCLDVDAPLLQNGFEILSHQDVVFGPAVDGGYYLVGCKRPLPPIFDDIAWSRATVLAETIRRLAKPSWRLALLPPWYDVDTLDDWQMLRGHLAALRRAGRPLPAAHPVELLDASIRGVPLRLRGT